MRSTTAQPSPAQPDSNSNSETTDSEKHMVSRKEDCQAINLCGYRVCATASGRCLELIMLCTSFSRPTPKNYLNGFRHWLSNRCKINAAARYQIMGFQALPCGKHAIRKYLASLPFFLPLVWPFFVLRCWVSSKSSNWWHTERSAIAANSIRWNFQNYKTYIPVIIIACIWFEVLFWFNFKSVQFFDFFCLFFLLLLLSFDGTDQRRMEYYCYQWIVRSNG